MDVAELPSSANVALYVIFELQPSDEDLQAVPCATQFAWVTDAHLADVMDGSFVLST